MNIQPVVQSKSAANGFPLQRVERDGGTRSMNKVQSAKSKFGRMTNTGVAVSGKAGSLESSCRDRLVYLITCLIGHPVEVLLKNGSVYTGIFHATDAEKDFGIILKVARMIKDGTSRGQKPRSEFVNKVPSKILIIPAQELVQVVAKDVAVTRDGLSNDPPSEKQLELLTDAYISQHCHLEVERELKPWVPDEDVPQCPELENLFDGPWNRGWDQFEANEKMFGVKSTFNEDLYTTKLERGPGMRELEQEAIRIAREIEGEDTQDLHIAEERGFQLHEKFDFDEETRYSSVHRGGGFDDSGYEDEEDILLDSRNALTFGVPSASEMQKPALTSSRINDEAWDDTLPSQSNTNVDISCSVSDEHDCQLASECASKDLPALGREHRMENQNGERGNGGSLELLDKQRPADGTSVSIPGDPQSGKEDRTKVGQYANATSSDSSCVPSKTGKTQSSYGGQSGSQGSGKAIGSKISESLDSVAATSASSGPRLSAASVSSGPGLSPSSSVGSFSSEKSALNTNAKEFKLNPNAKSFKPSHSSARPPSPVSDGSFYYPVGVSPVPQMPGMPAAFGIGPSYAGHQNVIYSPQLAPVQSPQPYFPPNGPQYGQQMFLGQPRQVVYMPTYQPEMSWIKGRDY